MDGNNTIVKSVREVDRNNEDNALSVSSFVFVSKYKVFVYSILNEMTNGYSNVMTLKILST